jgi:hypothetical protein
MVGRTAMSAGTLVVPEDRQSRIELCLRPVGYLRGIVHSPSGQPAERFNLSVASDGFASVSGFLGNVLYSGVSGEFVLGPLPEGRATVWAGRVNPEREQREQEDMEIVTGPGNSFYSEPAPGAIAGWPESLGVGDSRVVEIRSDCAARVELFPKKQFAPRPRVTAHPFSGRVCLADGRTPARGASVVIAVPNTRSSRYGTSDASGRICITGIADVFDRAAYDIAEGNTSAGNGRDRRIEASFVAWLPGACGAMMTQFEAEDTGRPLKIVLPPPLAVRGKVSVGGKPIWGWNSQFYVLAAYEGEGPLKEISTRRVSAEADGSFELPALTPGTYRVQAAMDGIWLSPSVRLNVDAKSEPPQHLTLDIGEPGPPSVIRVVDKQGKPVPGVEATVVRPAGPLAETLWPMHFESDGAGVINIPPLEAGTHRARIHGAPIEYSLVVPPLSKANITPAGPPVVVEQN